MRRRLPVILAALATVFLAARPSAAQNPRLERPTTDQIAVTGGSGADAWTLRYGTYGTWSPMVARLVVASNDRVYFSHGDTLRLIDGVRGMVTGRWRLPCPIVGLEAAGANVRVQLECADRPAPHQARTVDFNPDAPPEWRWSMAPTYSSPDRVESIHVLPGSTNLFGCAPASLFRRLPVPDSVTRLYADAVSTVSELVRRDPWSPWLRMALAQAMLLTGDARRPQALASIADASALDFRELLTLADCVQRMGDETLTQHLFDRAYADFLRRGHDPRLTAGTFRSLYSPRQYLGMQSWVTPEAMERAYRLTPYYNSSEIEWEAYARELDATGRADLARTWHGRAADARANSLTLLNRGAVAILDRAFLAGLAAMAAVFSLTAAFVAKYWPQRRLMKAARARGAWVARGFGLFTVEYWSRRERLAVASAAAALWCAVGFGHAYGRVYQAARAPMSAHEGSLASPSALWYLEHGLDASPERDLLIALGHQQAGAAAKAEALYRALPQFATSWNNLGVLLEQGGRHAEAQQAFQRALAIEPGLAEAALNSGRPPSDLWTTVHDRYARGTPMIAPPRRDALFRAVAGSPTAVAMRTLRGPRFDRPVFDFVQPPRGLFPMVPFELFVIERTEVEWLLSLAAACVWGLAILALVCPRRDVTQAPGRAFTGLSLAVPGASPAWRWMSGPAAMTAAYLLVECALMYAFGTPGVTSASATLPGRRTDYEAASIAFGNPSWWLLAGLLCALYGANTFLVRRSHLRAARYGGQASA